MYSVLSFPMLCFAARRKKEIPCQRPHPDRANPAKLELNRTMLHPMYGQEFYVLTFPFVKSQSSVKP